MPDTKITALAAIGANPINVATFPIPMVDLTDTSMAASGTTKKVTVNQILGAGGTATLASATISGNLTVDTSTFAVDAANNRVFVGTAPVSTAYPLFVTRGGTAGSIAQFTDGTAQTLTIDSAAGGLIVGNANNGYVAFTANGLEQYRIAPLGVFTWADGAGGTRMTLNSTGLGVGVASPTSKLTIGTGSYSAAASGTTGMYTTASGLEILSDSYFFGSRTGGVLMTLTAAGNLGIGVTPSAWNSNYRALQIGLAGALFNDNFNEELNVSSNAYYDSVDNRYEFIRTGYAQRYTQTNNGQHQWHTSSSSGNANSAIAFTQAMTLDASGRLIINSSTFIPPTLNTNGELNFIATSNTNVRFSYRGTDGVTRVANITLA